MGDDDLPPEATEFLKEIREAVEGRDFASIEELQAFVKQLNDARNSAPLTDFCGLSPEQMHRMLHFPFTSPHIARFAETFAEPPAAPVLDLVMMLAEACAGKGLKATATGNLPRAFCRETALAYWGKEHYEKWMLGRELRQEQDCFDLHVTRHVATMAGLLRKYQGRFLLTKRGASLREAADRGSVYLGLFRTYTGKFNWGFRDGYEELSIVQQSFLYSLFLLAKFGAAFRPAAFYEGKFLQAFPDVLGEINEPAYRSKESYIGRCYTLRTMERFAYFFGLIEIKDHKPAVFRDTFEMRKRPLLDRLVTFAATGA